MRKNEQMCKYADLQMRRLGWRGINKEKKYNF
jgi:hypothetical protein